MRLAVLLSLLLAPASPAPQPTAGQAIHASPGPLSADELYSRRALRRARLLIQMRVMQLREERLECIRAALKRQLPGALWEEVPSPPRGSADVLDATRDCEESLKF